MLHLIHYIWIKEFEKVKANIGEHLRKVPAMDKSINTIGDSIATYISEKNQEQQGSFLLGLTYLNLLVQYQL